MLCLWSRTQTQLSVIINSNKEVLFIKIPKVYHCVNLDCKGLYKMYSMREVKEAKFTCNECLNFLDRV